MDLLKLIFAYFIAFGHFDFEIFPSGVSVQFFFIISGFFLGRNFYVRSFPTGGKVYTQLHYTRDHVKSLYPHYLFSLIVLALYTVVKALWDSKTFSSVAHTVYKLIPELFLMQNAGFFSGGLNYPLWQVCTMVIAGYFIYGLLCVNEKISRSLILPAAILLIQAFLATSDVPLWGTVGAFHVPLLRAFSPLCIGVLTYWVTTTPVFTKFKERRVLFNVLSILALVLFLVFQGYQRIFLLLAPFILFGFWNSDSWINIVLNHRIFRFCGNFSYAVYLNHALVDKVLTNHIFPRITGETVFQKNLMFFAAVTVYSVITLFIVNRLQAKRKSAAV